MICSIDAERSSTFWLAVCVCTASRSVPSATSVVEASMDSTAAVTSSVEALTSWLVSARSSERSVASSTTARMLFVARSRFADSVENSS